MTNGRLSRRIRLEVDGVQVLLRVLPHAAAEEGSAALPVVILTDWSFFNALEERIVRLLLDGPLSREEIARKLDESADGKVKPTLAGLASRRVLRTTADGYAVNAIGERLTELRSWLASRPPCL